MNITIPTAALEAGARAIAEQLGDDWDDNVHTFCGDDFQMTPDGAKEACRQIARAAFLAILENWPGMTRECVVMADRMPCIILPLTENTDAKR